MIEQKQSGTSIFRVMAKALVPDADVWAKSTGSKMDQNNPALRAAKDLLFDQNIGFNESMYKQVLRGICSECKTETEKK
ncbi:hypothetical protein BpHYR1_003118 [Brachionus plicatilis]|uniref:Uncharacterized protein n=1 Tax=Brachionus plicatilis TaxID=10195 RepID=A0A3M7SUN7_BRAPC|nr:hypothetical protein BpHYR1_003118 [Brachionus plicatilis]